VIVDAVVVAFAHMRVVCISERSGASGYWRVIRRNRHALPLF
jgi:hypothetical protein